MLSRRSAIPGPSRGAPRVAWPRRARQLPDAVDSSTRRRIVGTAFVYPRRSKRFKRVDADVAAVVPKFCSAEAASATSASGGNRSSMNRWGHRNAARSQNARTSDSDTSPSSRAVYPWQLRFHLAVLGTAALGVVASSAAFAQSPASYRAQLNRHCRTFTPKFKRIERNIEKAAKAKDLKAVAQALGRG
jgi:hypothetical protein